MDEYTKLDSIDFSLKNNVLNYIIFKVSKIAIEAPNEDIKNIVVQVFTINKEKKKAFRKFNFEQLEIRDIISPFAQFIEESCENSNNLSTITEAFVTHKQLINDFYRQYEIASVQNLILRIMAIILKSEIKEIQNTNKLNHLESNEAAPNALDEELERKPATFEQLVRSDLKKVLKEIKLITNPDSIDSVSTEFTINGLIIPGIGILVLVFVLLLVFLFYEVYNSNRSGFKKFENITKQLSEIYTPSTEGAKDYGYLKTEFEKLSKPDPPAPKKTDSKGPVSPASKNDTSDFDTIASKLQTDLMTLNTKISELNAFKVPDLSKKIENKLSDEQIKKIFDSVVKDETSDFGLAMKKIKDLGNKGPLTVDDTASAKDKGTIDTLKQEKGSLQNKINAFEKDLKVEKESVNKLNGEVDKKNKEIDKLETKLKSIGDEKTGFKGLTGNFAILFTNSKDFPLNQSILSTAFTLIEKQPKDQKFGVYIATGNQIAANLDLRDKKEKSLNLISPTGSPTEMLSDAGQAFLDYAFDGKNPIPIPDRKAIIIATWSAEAPKFNSSGWKDISQVDAILIQPANVQQIRYAKSWLDFVNQKNGRLLLISGPDNFDAGSDNLKQLSKQISTLLNTKKD